MSTEEDGEKVVDSKSKADEVSRPLDESENGRPTCFHSTVQEVLFVLTATMATAMSSFLTGGNIVITSLVGEQLHMTNAEIAWISAASSLTGGAFLLFFGRIADMFGRRSLLIVSMGLYSLLSIATGFAPNALFLDAFNGLLGLCSAAAVPPAVGTLGFIYKKPSTRKNYAFACFSAGNPLGYVFGTVFSGVFTQVFGWRASYWYLAIVYGAFAIIAIFTMPKDQQKIEKFGVDAVKRFDLLGAALIITGIALFTSSLSLAGNAPQGWRTPYVPVFLVVGVLIIATFLYWESIFATPLMPLHIWRDRDFSLLMVIVWLGFSAFPPASFWLALYMQRIQHLSPLLVAVHLLPQAIMGTTTNIVAGLILHRVSNKLIMLVGAVCYTVSFLLLALQKQDSSYWAFIFPSLNLMVIGADLEFNVANMYVMSALPAHQQSIAGGIFQTLTRLAMTVGLGILTAVFNSVSSSLESAETPLKPYTAVFWAACGLSATSVCLVPFLTIGTQGGKTVGEQGAAVPNPEIAMIEPVSGSQTQMTAAGLDASIDK
ncbi:hypothetical protein MMC27_003099 [Xylographa pallens]|nr:hypothetical protein [Xylographa pallens]